MTSRCVHLLADGSVAVVEVPLPTLEPASEVCGTDVHLKKGHLGTVPYPIIPGHVSVGSIFKSGSGELRDVDGNLLQEGDIVTFLDVHETCNNCWFCLVAKTSTRCPKRKVYGVTYSANDGLLGGWSQYIYLKPGVKIIKLPTTLDPLVFMAAGCGLPTALHAVQRSNVQLGDTVVVQGSGPVGLMASIIAKIRGAFKVIVIGAPKIRLDAATKFGADHVISIDEVKDYNERVRIVQQLTSGRGADVTIECTGVPMAVVEGTLMTRDGGTYVVVGHYTDVGTAPINPHLNINAKHLNILGCWGSDFSHFHLGVRFMDQFQHKFPWKELISREYKLDQAAQGLIDVEKLEVVKAIITPN